MKTAITSCLAWFLVLGSTSFGAVVNGSFEDTPTFSGSGWNVQGLTFIQGTYLGIAPPDGSASQALLRTGDSGSGGTGASLALLADTLQVTLADITAVAPNATNGSAISQRITVRADDTLTFDWKFVTSEGAGQAQQDTAFFSVSRVGGTPQTSLLAHASSPGLVGFNEPPFSRQTNYFTSFPSSPPYKFTLDGDYFIGFGVVNVSDGFGQSGLLIDNVTLTAVPEPTALAGLGLLGLTLTMRRRRRLGARG